MNNCGQYTSLTQDFFTALGENKTLISLHIDTAYRYTYDFCNKLGKACAINAKKKGSLTTLSCKKGFDANTLNSFIKSLYTSEQYHEYMYGDTTVASKMSGEDLEKKIYTIFDSVQFVFLSSPLMILYKSCLMNIFNKKFL